MKVVAGVITSTFCLDFYSFIIEFMCLYLIAIVCAFCTRLVCVYVLRMREYARVVRLINARPVADACMAQGYSSLQAALVELQRSFGHSSFKSEVQKKAVLSITQGKL